MGSNHERRSRKPPRPSTTAAGAAAEQAARRFLEEQGLRTLACNYRARSGEIDLVMADGGVTVFVEVRRRKGRDLAGALHSVDRRKQRRLLRAAQQWLSRRPGLARFDVVAVSGEGNSKLQWVRNAFVADGPP